MYICSSWGTTWPAEVSGIFSHFTKCLTFEVRQSAPEKLAGVGPSAPRLGGLEPVLLAGRGEGVEEARRGRGNIYNHRA